MPEVTEYDLSALLICTVRYALGRRSYIVSDANGFVRRYLRDTNTRDVLVRDIKGQEVLGYGDSCDLNEWMDLLMWLEAWSPPQTTSPPRTPPPAPSPTP